MNILVIIGTRPNFIKVTRFKEVAKLYPGINLKIVHTGQHYDNNMADVFFKQFGLEPDYFLNISQGSANSQMAEIMVKLEKLIHDEFKPDLIMVVGDVNSTLAGALTANKSGIKLAHVESGLRSFDRSMPEEHNRILTDGLSDFHFITEQAGLDNLAIEGKPAEGIFFVGNTMIDTMVAFAGKIDSSAVLEKLNIGDKKFVLMTMHRPGNVDTKDGLQKLLELVNHLSQKYTVIFPVHPRTVKNMEQTGLENEFRGNKNLLLTDPLDYFSFQKLIQRSSFIITDSGGIQEESTFLQVPCLTLRPNTERPVTITSGSNELVPFEIEKITSRIEAIENGSFKKGTIPPLWDGKATERIFEAIDKLF
ncbi:MAG: UDP-N-acetylglucosamine 2-epimerase (non-hydrolyzing) [Bacteroidota bacterium]|nr:UDP-N-acetylglucosamine 2-epimerase (non-hydrolyzing) [Bacteroidota bacterium]